jgi:hypothetical protein
LPVQRFETAVALPLHIAARGEGAFPGTGQDDDADRTIAACGFDRVLQFCDGLAPDRVQLRRPVDGDGADRIGA